LLAQYQYGMNNVSIPPQRIGHWNENVWN
jgi:hypothetical protein